MTEPEIHAVKEYVIARLQTCDHFVISIANLREDTQVDSLVARDVIKHWRGGLDGFSSLAMPSWDEKPSSHLVEIRFQRILGVAPSIEQ